MGCLKSKAKPNEEFLDGSSYPEPTVYEFNFADDDECRKNFREVEEWYNTDQPYYKELESKDKELEDLSKEHALMKKVLTMAKDDATFLKGFLKGFDS